MQNYTRAPLMASGHSTFLRAIISYLLTLTYPVHIYPFSPNTQAKRAISFSLVTSSTFPFSPGEKATEGAI